MRLRNWSDEVFSPTILTQAVHLSGVGKLASGRSKEHIISQHHIDKISFVRTNGVRADQYPILFAEALNVCVRTGVQDQLKGTPSFQR